MRLQKTKCGKYTLVWVRQLFSKFSFSASTVLFSVFTFFLYFFRIYENSSSVKSTELDLKCKQYKTDKPLSKIEVLINKQYAISDGSWSLKKVFLDFLVSFFFQFYKKIQCG